MKVYWEWRYSSTSLTLALDGGEWSVSFMLQVKNHWYPLDRTLGGPHRWSRHSGEEKNSQPLLGLKPLIIQPVAQHYTTELFYRTKCFSSENCSSTTE
jgi:hypothetical protein